MEMPFACPVQVGSGHLQRGVPCQDSAAGFATEHASCIVLADGAGSRPDAHKAAQAVTAALSRQGAENFARWAALSDLELRRLLVQQARAAVEAEAPGTEPACTLLLFAAAADGACLLAHLGDGIALGVGKDAAALVSAPENGAESNVTYFVSSRSAVEHLRLRRTLPADCHSVVLCSDGSAAALYNNRTGQVARAAAVLARMTASLPAPVAEAYMREDLDRLFRTHTPDDMGLAVLCRNPAAAAGQGG